MAAILPVTEATLPLLMQGLRALAEDLGDPFLATGDGLARALFADPPACHGLVTSDDAGLRGAALFSPLMSTMQGAAGVYVSDLWIAPGARGDGLGRALLAAVAQRGRALWSAGFLRLACHEHNTRALAFYRREGFLPPEDETMLRLSGPAFDRLARSG